MSKYSLNDDSTKFYNKIYRIFIIAFILILIIGLVSNPNNSSNYVLGMIGCAAFILPLFFFVMKTTMMLSISVLCLNQVNISTVWNGSSNISNIPRTANRTICPPEV